VPLSSPPPSSCLVHRRHCLAPPIAATIAAALAAPPGNAFHMGAMAVAMTAAMAVARQWRRAAFIVIGDIKGVK